MKPIFRRLGVQRQFTQIMGEVGFSYSMIENMFDHLHLDVPRGVSAIQKICEEKELVVYLDELGITTKAKPALKHLVPRSCLQDILDGLHIPATMDDLQGVAADLGYMW